MGKWTALRFGLNDADGCGACSPFLANVAPRRFGKSSTRRGTGCRRLGLDILDDYALAPDS